MVPCTVTKGSLYGLPFLWFDGGISLKLISSDTNIWLEFNTIAKLDLPFKLPYIYIMYKEALREEIISPPSILSELQEYGLLGVELTSEEFFYAADLAYKYVKLSGYDRIAGYVTEFT